MLNRIFSTSGNLTWLVLAMLGIVAGLSLFTFVYAKGASYLRDDPEACINCHIMREPFEAWTRSSHKQAANCNSCHTPQKLLPKYITKAVNGWNHGLAFTTGDFADPLQIKPFNRQIALDNCVRCHLELNSPILHDVQGQMADCLACHGNVGH